MTAKKEPKITKAERIRALLSEGKTASEVATALGVPRQYVYGIAHLDRKKAKKAKKAKKVAPKRKYARTAPASLTWKQRFTALFTGRVA